MTKIKATFLHFILSLLVITAFLSVVYWVWYDQIFVIFSGVLEPIKVLILVDVVIGPFLTLLLYRPGKKHVKFDISVIALVQLSAFVYGAYNLYIGKPALVVMKSSGFEVVIQKEINHELSEDLSSKLGLFSKPVYAKIKEEKLSLLSLATEQQADIVALESEDLDIRKLSLDQVFYNTNMKEPELLRKLGVENLDSIDLYLLLKKSEYVIFAFQNDKPWKIVWKEKKKFESESKETD